MYAGVPIKVPDWVIGSLTDGGAAELEASRGSPPEPARPKSSTSTRPLRPTITLVGLKSRCTIPARCAAASPRPAWM